MHFLLLSFFFWDVLPDVDDERFERRQSVSVAALGTHLVSPTSLAVYSLDMTTDLAHTPDTHVGGGGGVGTARKKYASNGVIRGQHFYQPMHSFFELWKVTGFTCAGRPAGTPHGHPTNKFAENQKDGGAQPFVWRGPRHNYLCKTRQESAANIK